MLHIPEVPYMPTLTLRVELRIFYIYSIWYILGDQRLDQENLLTELCISNDSFWPEKSIHWTLGLRLLRRNV